MADKKPELRLYRAHCHADGCSEGEFITGSTDKRETERYKRAMETIERYINSGWRLELSGVYDIVGSEKEAQELIAICQGKFQGTNPIIKPNNSQHGRIIFERKVEFSQHTMKDIDGLITQMQDIESIKNHYIGTRALQNAFGLYTW